MIVLLWQIGKKKKKGKKVGNGNIMNLLDDYLQLCCQYPACPSLPFLRWVSSEWEDRKWSLTLHPVPRQGLLALSLISLVLTCCQYITGCLEAAAHVFGRASQGCSSAPSRLWSFRGKQSLIYFVGWSVCCCFGFVPMWLSGLQLCKFCPCHPRGTLPSPWHVFSARVMLVFAWTSSKLWAF